MKGSEGNGPLMLRWLGHASFLVTFPGGVRWLSDPMGPDVGYGRPNIVADVVTVSHEHDDHNYVSLAGPAATVFRGLTPDGSGWNERVTETRGLKIYAVPTFHDESGGKKRGKNSVFVVEGEGFRICHLGDLGHELEREQLDRIGEVTILFLPVGGYYTIDAAVATGVMESISARVTIPMHFRTQATAGWPISPVDDFLRGKGSVKKVGSTVSVEAGELPESPEIWVMDYAGDDS